MDKRYQPPDEDGTPLDRLIAECNPLVGPSGADPAAYTAWAAGVCAQVESAIQALHARGLTLGGVEPGDVLVRPDGRVTLARLGLAAPGPVEVDTHALARLRLALFLPLTELVRLDLDKATELADVIGGYFPVPRTFLDDAVRAVNGGSRAKHLPAWHCATLPDPERWERLRRSMGNAILDHDDELFGTGGITLAYGAAGVLYALDATGVGRFPDHERRLIERATRPGEGAGLGFYDGLHGIAHTLAHLGHRREALELVEIVSRERWETLGLDLHGGLAGIGLNLLHLSETTGEHDLRERALKVADLVARRLGESGVGGAGLMTGSSGPALLFLRLFQRTGDRALLDLAKEALRQDLRRYDQRSRDLRGVGLAWVLDIYLAHRHDEELANAFKALDQTARSPFYRRSGLLTGRAGALAYLARGRGEDPAAEAQLRALGWHAVRHDAHIAFPGEQLTRLSMDLATGTAGVLLAVGAALHDEVVALPFLSPREMEV
ncbi:lanthionine synthetase LanC family protein [Nonomuraea sp. NPDC050556]|uniref:lanthionine synthetase LanC family protein n=1 Tax=Nonomuraea sp. NPDC050556 TaxID=3364369 RepID=UPI0037A36288